MKHGTFVETAPECIGGEVEWKLPVRALCHKEMIM